MSKIKDWYQFTKERFEPLSHLSMIIVFVLAHVFIARSQGNTYINPTSAILLLIGVVAFYFKLRLYDEVKDFDLDVVINKTRPLPRGLLTHKDMYIGMSVCIIVEILCFGFQGKESYISITIAVLYSLLMYKEFFIPEIIRPYLTTYALVHTIVTTILSFAIFSFLTKLSFFEVMFTMPFLSFALANWLLFNIFEFGRKTFATSEERAKVDTYSSLFGRTGAVMLVVSQALITHYLAMSLNGTNPVVLLWGLGILLLILAILAVRYILTDKPSAAKKYRFFTSLYIVLFYLILILSFTIS